MGEVGYKTLAIDIETFSDVDLIKCGVYAYADSPAFEILLFAYSFDDEESGVSDVTARAALAYRKVADRMSDEWLSYLAGQYGQIKEELDFFEHAVRGLSGKLPEIVWDMAVERFTWEELMMKYHISHTMVAKYRKKAIKELDALYEERDRQTESFILR